MEVSLYREVIFFVNCVMDFSLLYLVKKILKKSASIKRIALGAFAGGIGGCLEVLLWKWPPWIIMTVSFAMAGLMVTIAFGQSDWRELVKQMGSLYILAVLANGIMELLYQYTRAGFYLIRVIQGEGIYAMPLLAWLFMAAGACLMVRALWQFADEIVKERANKYPVILGGDFNARHYSEAIRGMDSWFAASNDDFGMPAWKPVIKIDYLFAYPQKGWRVISTQTVQSLLSDHLPIITELEYVKEASKKKY